MKYVFVVLILLIVGQKTCAHEDRYYTYEFENVTVRFKTGFFFEEIHNVKIIGKYASLLSDRMDYDKPILLDFIHDYGHTYQGNTFSFLNIGSEEYELVSFWDQSYDSIFNEDVYHMVPYSDSVENINNIEKEVYTIPRIDREDKIVIRQFGFHFDVTKTLNLLYYAINNKSEVLKLSRTDTLYSYLSNMYYSLETLPSSIVDSIKSSTVPYVASILQTQVYREVDSVDRHRLYYSYFSKNGKLFVFAGIHDKEIILDTLDQVYSINPMESIPAALFVFETPNQFRKYNVWIHPKYDSRRSRQHKIPIDPYEYISSISIEWLGDDIYLINYNNSLISPFKRFPYIANDEVLIEDFDSYINSYRKDDK